MDAIGPHLAPAGLTPVAAPLPTRHVQALEEGLTPVEQLPPEQAAQRMSYLRAVGGDIASLRHLPLRDLDESAVDGNLQAYFATSTAELGPEATAAGVAFARANKSAAAAPAASSAPPDLADLAERLKRLFPKIDKNKDGILSHAEVQQAMKDPTIKGKDAAALNVLVRYGDQIQWLSHDESDRPYDQKGVSLKDLERLGRGDMSEHQRISKGHNADFMTKAVKLYAHFQKQIEGQSSQLFEGMPDPSSVKQGQVGNCFFLAAVVALASKDPGAIKKMIKENPDGSYTVTFPGKPPVKVPALTDAEKAVASKSNGLWVAVLEKAYAKLTNQGGPNPMEPGYMGSVDTGLDPFSKNGRAEGIFLSGAKPGDIRLKLIRAFKEGRLVEAGCVQPKMKGLVAGHAYTVLSFDERSDKLTLRNPWGNTEPGSDGKDDGVFVITFPDFMANFFSLGISA